MKGGRRISYFGYPFHWKSLQNNKKFRLPMTSMR